MTDDTYVHEPESMGSTSAPTNANASPDGTTESDGDRQGWLLIGAIVLAFVVAPALIWLRPPALPFKMAYLVLPLVPAILLATVAVLTTTRR